MTFFAKPWNALAGMTLSLALIGGCASEEAPSEATPTPEAAATPAPSATPSPATTPAATPEPAAAVEPQGRAQAR